MSLVENWRKIAQLNLSATSPLDNNNARGFGMALASAAADLESACTPRPPKAEWFGEAPGKWDCWMIRLTSNWFLLRGAKTIKQGRQIYDEMSDDFFSMDSIAECVPVTREGFPTPVGWSVVGG